MSSDILSKRMALLSATATDRPKTLEYVPLFPYMCGLTQECNYEDNVLVPLRDIMDNTMRAAFLLTLFADIMRLFGMVVPEEEQGTFMYWCVFLTKWYGFESKWIEVFPIEDHITKCIRKYSGPSMIALMRDEMREVWARALGFYVGLENAIGEPVEIARLVPDITTFGLDKFPIYFGMGHTGFEDEYKLGWKYLKVFFEESIANPIRGALMPMPATFEDLLFEHDNRRMGSERHIAPNNRSTNILRDFQSHAEAVTFWQGEMERFDAMLADKDAKKSKTRVGKDVTLSKTLREAMREAEREAVRKEYLKMCAEDNPPELPRGHYYNEDGSVSSYASDCGADDYDPDTTDPYWSE